ncbi:MAG TPA: glutathione transferase GstA [Bdellovibrio sp.]|uniref:glutathione transferase GstA n=1 Tax=Bdellovibrio sp. TaxID=28201 RepID=UPI002EF7A894
MNLYYSPGACALAPQIILREAGLPFQLIKVDLKTKQYEGGDYKQINPKGYVPALQFEDHTLLTEGCIILQWIADRAPEKNLIPPWGSPERYKAMEWLNYISTELHKGYSPLFYPQVFGDAALLWHRDKIQVRLQLIDKHLANNDFMMGKEFSVVDAYLYNILRWSDVTKVDLTPHHHIATFIKKMKERPSVQEAVAAEGIRL